MEISNIEGLAKQTEPVSLIVKYTGDTKGLKESGVSEVTIKVRYNSNLLTPTDAGARQQLAYEVKDNKKWAIMTLTTKNPYTITGTKLDKQSGGPGEVLFNIPMYVLLGDTISTPITFVGSPVYTGGKVRITKLINGKFDLNGICEKGDKRLIGGGLSITKISPNPATGSMKLNYQSDRSGKLEVVITDMRGETKLMKILEEGVGINSELSEQINVSELSSGMYFIELRQEGKTDKKILQIVK